MTHDKLQNCIDACLECASECERCATECIKENNLPELRKCIELDRQCAIVCLSNACLMSIRGDYATILCYQCAEICSACADECEMHSDMEHCRKCAEACRKCADECRSMVGESII